MTHVKHHISTIHHAYIAMMVAPVAYIMMVHNAMAGPNGSTGCNGEVGNVNELGQQLSCELGSTPTLFASISYILGIGFTIAGLFKLKEYVDEPDRSPIAKSLMRLGVGALLILLPFTIEVVAGTFGENSQGTLQSKPDLEVFG